MKKVQFKKLTITPEDILTRGEMKSVTGGYTCWCYHSEHTQPDGDGKEVDCGDTDDISGCCGGTYDSMNCF